MVGVGFQPLSEGWWRRVFVSLIKKLNSFSQLKVQESSKSNGPQAFQARHRSAYKWFCEGITRKLDSFFNFLGLVIIFTYLCCCYGLQGGSTTFAEFKRIWLSKKFSYMFEASPSTNQGCFMQSLYAHCIGMQFEFFIVIL